MEKKKTKKSNKPKNIVSDIAYLLHRVVSSVEMIKDGRLVMHAEFQMLHNDIDLLLKDYM